MSELYDGDKLGWPGTHEEQGVSGYPESSVELLANSDTLKVGKILDKVPLFGSTIDHFATGYNKALDVRFAIGFDQTRGNVTSYPTAGGATPLAPSLGNDNASGDFW